MNMTPPLATAAGDESLTITITLSPLTNNHTTAYHDSRHHYHNHNHNHNNNRYNNNNNNHYHHHSSGVTPGPGGVVYVFALDLSTSAQSSHAAHAAIDAVSHALTLLEQGEPLVSINIIVLPPTIYY